MGKQPYAIKIVGFLLPDKSPVDEHAPHRDHILQMRPAYNFHFLMAGFLQLISLNILMLKIYSRSRLANRIIDQQDFRATLKVDSETIAFEEKPCAGKFSEATDYQIAATDLFSMFTADIITANKTFVR